QTVLSGGKRLRPILTYTVSDIFGVSHKIVEPYCRAIELIHAASLAHDDVIDNADIRRGKPSINVVATNRKAILSGDYLLANVLMEVSRLRRADIIEELSEVISELAEGEWIQIENSSKRFLTWNDIEEVALKKTGSIMRLCCTIPAFLSDAPKETLYTAQKLGEKFGTAFQLANDILDFKREDSSGFQDIKSGVISSVVFHALSISQNRDYVTLLPEKIQNITRNEIPPAIEKVKERVSVILDESREILAKLRKTASRGRIASEACEGMTGIMNLLADGRI
ncbi:MAG: polyprenyl synthetase family protein, partial [Oligoflexales bacterium]|nr:polyprenyl synthetase family protein [Oligoflexales bacterium]